MKKLSELILDIHALDIKNFKDVFIESLAHKAADCEPSSIYFCLKGKQNDGHNFAKQAVKLGAKVLVVEKFLDIDAIQILVKNSRIAMAQIAKNFYDKADEKLKIVSIVGTNGKTTTSMVIARILRDCGKSVGVIGTNGVYFDDELSLPCDLTTPDPIELHYIFSQLVSFGVEYAVIEASAHAIYLNKLYGIKSELGIFTNISNEHLDYFETMENYSKVKMNYFNATNMKFAIINIDDIYGRDLAKNLDIPYLTYGIFNPANTFAIDIKTSMGGSDFIVNASDEIMNIKSSLVGDFNVYNLLAGITAALYFKCTPRKIESSIKNMQRVDGRFNVFELSRNRKIVIDFAHTPDGFEKTLSLIKMLRKGKITTLFGCVEYADFEKRKTMGAIADKYSDELIITADNPNFAKVEDIGKDIAMGIKKCKYKIIEDREMAIIKAVINMQNNDTLVILGKGAEKYQKINGKLVEYSDIEVVEKLVN